MNHELKPHAMNSKKYILKPGRHQFAPGEPAIHDNDSLTDKQARWYLKAYPHIISLFTHLPASIKTQSAKTPPKISGIKTIK